MAPSPLSDDRQVAEFINLSQGSSRVSGYRTEIDCQSSRLRIIGQVDYGQVGSGRVLALQRDDRFEILNERNGEFLDPDEDWRPLVAETCRLALAPGRQPDFSNVDEFVAASARVDDGYFTGEHCIHITTPPKIIAPSSN